MVNINSVEQSYHRNYAGGNKTTADHGKASFGSDLEEAIAGAANAADPSENTLLYVQTSSGKKALLDKNALISLCHAPTGESANVYQAEGYSENDPLYLVKGTTENGSTYEQIVDVSKVDPSNCSYIELLALSAHTGHNDFFTMSILKDQAESASYHDSLDYLSMAYDRMDDLKLLKQWDSYLRYDRWVTDILEFFRSNDGLFQ